MSGYNISIEKRERETEMSKRTSIIKVTDRIGNEWEIVKRELDGFPDSYRVHKNGSIMDTKEELFNAVKYLGEHITAH